ncbi:hypothetical protein BAU15_12805 [Enterococcus sp. JM4C]|uniref:type II toxin-antitoxin system RelB/DinJ family antitoxin n=1 Tax=Candidatus Enterococcus huntleyi TaxID=1857217 RepID=UPI0013799C28|nr:type II toxin-antitoxin system RelB/DinJ family antitoxin [Enterococcus sp. JM4C]KAF1296429.1 hypothetical protein BAU15_12805 [Enterococcus sp. JM4C]
MAQLTIKIDNEFKEQAQQAFDEMGLDLDTAIRVFLKQVVRTGEFPFIPQSDKAQAIHQVEQLMQLTTYDTTEDWWQAINGA